MFSLKTVSFGYVVHNGSERGCWCCWSFIHSLESFICALAILDSLSYSCFLFLQENGPGFAPVLLEYFDNDAPSTELRVTFEKCLFEENYFTGEPGQAALVVGNSQQNRLVFEQCLFVNNDMVVNNRDVSLVSNAWIFNLCLCFRVLLHVVFECL
jgi:hypothetical protein